MQLHFCNAQYKLLKGKRSWEKGIHFICKKNYQPWSILTTIAATNLVKQLVIIMDTTHTKTAFFVIIFLRSFLNVWYQSLNNSHVSRSDFGSKFIRQMDISSILIQPWSCLIHHLLRLRPTNSIPLTEGASNGIF